jgi:metal-responsive CopG/Arc/MetJ family transcriptional regulator
MKKKITITIDSQIYDLLNQHLINLKIGNKSKYINDLIKKEIKDHQLLENNK